MCRIVAQAAGEIRINLKMKLDKTEINIMYNQINNFFTLSIVLFSVMLHVTSRNHDIGLFLLQQIEFIFQLKFELKLYLFFLLVFETLAIFFKCNVKHHDSIYHAPSIIGKNSL